MQVCELYQQILGLTSPWLVESVELYAANERIVMYVRQVEGERLACPECERRLPCCDHFERRRWRHLDSCQHGSCILRNFRRMHRPLARRDSSCAEVSNFGQDRCAVASRPSPVGWSSRRRLELCATDRGVRAQQTPMLAFTKAYLSLSVGTSRPITWIS